MVRIISVNADEIMAKRPERPESISRGSTGRSSAPQTILERGPVVPADPDDVDPTPKREKRWKTKLAHPQFRIVYDECPQCGFPECAGGYCADCGWSEKVKLGVYVL